MSEAMRKGIWDPNRPFRPDRLPFFYGWIIAGLGAFGIAASIPGQTVGVNVFSERLIAALSLERSDVSLAYLIGTASSGLMLPWAGKLYDRWGARRLFVFGSVGLGASLLLMSHIDALGRFLARGTAPERHWLPHLAALAFGFFLIRFWGQGVLTLTARNMVGKWWKNHRGKILSLSGIAVSVCFSLAPKASDWLIEATDWRTAWQLMGAALILGVAAIGWLGFRDNPEECGLRADGGRGKVKGQVGNPEFATIKEFTRRDVLRSYPFWVFSGIFALHSCYFTAYSFHVIDVARSVALPKETALTLFFPAAALGGAISIFIGWASDRWRLKYMMTFMAVGVGLAPLGLLVGGAMALPTLLVLGFGIAGGCFGTLSGAFMPRFFGLQHLGAISGVFMTLIVMASAVGPYLFSVANARLGSYDPVHFAAAASAVVLAILALKGNNPQRILARRQAAEMS